MTRTISGCSEKHIGSIRDRSYWWPRTGRELQYGDGNKKENYWRKEAMKAIYPSTIRYLLWMPTKSITWTIGISVGRISSPNTFESISRAAALHFRKFHTLTMSSSCRFEKCDLNRTPQQLFNLPKIINESKKPYDLCWVNLTGQNLFNKQRKNDYGLLTSSSALSDPWNREEWKRGLRSCRAKNRSRGKNKKNKTWWAQCYNWRNMQTIENPRTQQRQHGSNLITIWEWPILLQR